MARGFAADCKFLRPEGSTYSPAHDGILSHVKTRLVNPFSEKFEPSFKNSYFFRPIKLQFEENGFKKPVLESLLDQIASVVFPIIAFIDPLSVVDTGAFLAIGHFLNSLVAFCTAMYLFAKETLNGNRDYSEAVDNLKETASNFLIALCMPVVGTTAAVLDCVRLVTRCVATLVNLVQENCMDSPAAAPAL
jgi:hypothetical protein